MNSRKRKRTSSSSDRSRAKKAKTTADTTTILRKLDEEKTPPLSQAEPSTKLYIKEKTEINTTKPSAETSLLFQPKKATEPTTSRKVPRKQKHPQRSSPAFGYY